MRFKQMSRWTFLNTLKGYGVFMAVYWAVILLASVFLAFTLGRGDLVHDGGIASGGSTAIFVLVYGIVGFSMYLRVGFANGVSRKTVFFSNLTCFVLVCFIAALGEVLTGVMSMLILSGTPTVPLFGASNTFVDWISYYLLTVCSLLAAAALGLFVGGAFYRMSKMAKILVSVFAGVLLFFGLPLLAIFAQAEFLQFLVMNVLVPILNFFTSSVWASMLGLLLFAAVLTLFTWLCMRRAPAKAAK